MRFLILTRPHTGDLDLARYHDELVQAGVLLAGDQAAGFWLLEVDSPEEAAEWGRRVPGGEVEIREVRDTPSGARQSNTAESR
jgi:hypothetical protein